jgi:hypothetical protein
MEGTDKVQGKMSRKTFLKTAAVINCFNLEDHAVTRRIELHPRKVGLEVGAYQINGATAQRVEERCIIDVAIPTYGHSLIEVREV